MSAERKCTQLVRSNTLIGNLSIRVRYCLLGQDTVSLRNALLRYIVEFWSEGIDGILELF